jgi:hypothetical protein
MANMNPSKTETEIRHRKIIQDTLVALQKQEDIMEHLTEDLKLFRERYKSCLSHNNAVTYYHIDAGDENIDLLGYGVITTETVARFQEYKSAMKNFQKGFEKSKKVIDELWNQVEFFRDNLVFESMRKDEANIDLDEHQWVVDALERGRRVAAQE